MRVQARRRRVPGLINMAGALLLLVVVISLALHAANNQPPSIAEFAPQAQQIKAAPQEQTATFANGAGGAANGAAAPSPSPSATPGLPPDAVIRQCVGDPPRQIEDPQSPPCVPYWHGNNGGATWHGVSSVSVQISAPCHTASYGNDQDYANFFNKRFELYGRKITLDCHQGSAGPAPGDAPSDRALADGAYGYGDFGSTYNNSAEGNVYYYDQLAHDGMVAGAAGFDNMTESWLAARDPHVAQYEMANDRLFTNLGDFACTWLAGKPPSHAGPTVRSQAQVRKFGIYFGYGNTYSPVSTAPLKQALAACGAAVPSSSDYEFQGNNGDNGDANTAAVQLRAAGVTTVFCLPDEAVQCAYLMDYSASDGYFPEWVLTTYGAGDRNWIAKGFQFPASETAGMFGISAYPRQVNPLREPWWWATHEVDPGAANSGEDEINWQNSVEYHSWLVLAAGLQMAGPNLNPTTWMRGLQRAAFPNPYPEPNMEGRVGFNGGSHTMTTDLNVWWWSNTDRSPYADESTGTICYWNHGQRVEPGSWQRLSGPDPLFQGPCDSGYG